MAINCIQVPDPIELRQRLEAEGRFNNPAERNVWSYLAAHLRLHSTQRRMWEMIQPVGIQDLYALSEQKLFPLEILLGRQKADWSDPLTVRNWVSKYAEYSMAIVERYPKFGYYPDPAEVLESGGGVCRGLGILTASILFSAGVSGVRLTQGLAGDPAGGHIWVTWYPADGSGPYVLETTSNDQIDHLPTYEEVAIVKYIPQTMAERLPYSQWKDKAVPEGRLYLCSDYAEGYPR